MKHFFTRPVLMSLATVAVIGSGLTFAHSARALTANIDLFETATILGITIARGNAGVTESEFKFIDRSGLETEDFFLPSVSGRDGAYYTIKLYNNSTTLNVYATTSEHVDMANGAYQMGHSVSSVTLLADEDNDTWWIIHAYY